jgi:hypothetical protein
LPETASRTHPQRQVLLQIRDPTGPAAPRVPSVSLLTSQNALFINSLCLEHDEHTMRRTEVSTEPFGSDPSAIHENRREKKR